MQQAATFRRRHEPKLIDFGKATDPPRPRRPFELEGIALQSRHVRVPFERERMNGLAALEPHGSQIEKAVGLEGKSSFLLKFATSAIENRLSGVDETLGNRPVPSVLAAVDRAAGMGNQDLEGPLAPSIHE